MNVESIKKKIEIAQYNINKYFTLWLESEKKNDHHLECSEQDSYDLFAYLGRISLKKDLDCKHHSTISLEEVLDI